MGFQPIEKFRFISDPGHGWVEVPLTIINELGIADKVSPYSYKHKGMAYLEEDCDVYRFELAMEAAKRSWHYVREYQANTPIRNYASFRQ